MNTNFKCMKMNHHFNVETKCYSWRKVLGLFILLSFGITCTTETVYGRQSDNNLISNAPVKVVTGVVKDTQGETMIGVSVSPKGSKTGTITDINGRYSISVPAGSTLVFSFVGYKTMEVNVGQKKNVDVVLESDNQILDEVVVVGYGTAKKKDLTGAASNLKGDNLSDRHTTQLSTALQGAVSGVLVTRSTSEPGSGASDILIRGVTTMGDTSPLIIVDGIPVSNINDVNAKDVESMSVLKDAASASIYGSRAAAGVILITTKRASDKELKLGYNFEFGLDIPTQQPKNVSFQRYLEMANELKYNDNPAGGKYSLYSEDQVNNWVKNNETDPDNYPITDWYKLLVKGSAPRQSHVLTLSGGGKVVKTRASLSYDRVSGLYKDATDTYERYMVRVNNDFNFNKYLSASLDLDISYAQNNEPAYSGVWTAIRAYSPAYAWRWKNGGLADVKGGNNPYGRLVNGGFKKGTTAKLMGKAELDFKPFTGFKLSAIISPNYTTSKDKTFNKKAGYTSQDDPTTIVGYFEGCSTTKLTEGRSDSHGFTFQMLANYNKTFGKHDINAMVGYEDYYYFHESLSAASDQFDLDNFPYLSAGPSNYLTSTGSAYENAYRSYFGRIMYNYDDKYLFQANVRRDGSSRFYKDNRWGTFPSFSAGWVISEENFMKNSKLDWLSFLKLRASYGTLGNERIGNYPYVSLMDFSSSLFYDSSSATTPTFYKGAAQVQYAMLNLTWETTTTYDIGLDAHFFKNRLGLTADYYYKKTKDMLIDLEIPKYIGYANPSQNAGKMHTKGLDVELSWNDKIGDFKYGITANISDYVSRMDDLSGTQFLGSKVKMEGSMYNEWYGYQSAGLFLTQADVDSSPKLNTSTAVGDVKYVDISGPDGKPDGKISPEYDRVLLGNSQPRFMYGGTINCSWKGFDLSMAFQGIGKQNVRLTSEMVQPLQNQWGSIPGILDGNYWSSYNTDAQNASARYPRLTYVNQESNNAMSTFWMFNGRYFRMKNITLGYTLPSSLTQKAHINNVRVYVSGSDLFCISNYPKGWDPERGTSSYPITTSVVFGLSVNF